MPSARDGKSMKARHILLTLVVLALPSHARAQQELDGSEVIAAPTPVAPAAYVSDGRRDPFVPLTGASASDENGAPRLEQLDLTGIFMGAPGNSLVVLEDPARRGHFVRVGESLGNARLLEILPDRAVFEVDDYGILRRDTLRLLPDRPVPAPAPADAAPTTPDSEEGT